MGMEIISNTFLREFAWSTYSHFVGVAFSLVGLFSIFSIIMFMVDANGGSAPSILGMLTRIIVTIFLLTSWKHVVEGAKDLIWAIEMSIQSKGSIEGALDNFQKSIANAPFWAGPIGLIKSQIASWALSLCVFLKFLIFYLYQFFWVVAVVLAPFVIPFFVLQQFDGVFRIYFYFILALLVVRIPWAAISAIIMHLIEFLGKKGEGHELESFLLFWISTLVAGITPFATIVLFTRANRMLGSAMALPSYGANLTAGPLRERAEQAIRNKSLQTVDGTRKKVSSALGKVASTTAAVVAGPQANVIVSLAKARQLKFALTFLPLLLIPNLVLASSTCEIETSDRRVGVIKIPLGAATTIELPYDFKFAVPGNPTHFEVVPVAQDSRIVVVQAKTTVSLKTSLTIGLKNSRAMSFWILPVAKEMGCVYAKVRRGL